MLLSLALWYYLANMIHPIQSVHSNNVHCMIANAKLDAVGGTIKYSQNSPISLEFKKNTYRSNKWRLH